MTDQDTLFVSVSDQGPGIDEKDLDEIFKKFYKGKTTKPGGLGLGLSIAERFVQAHGGEIEARNREGGGAAFTFRLPVEFFHAEENKIEP